MLISKEILVQLAVMKFSRIHCVFLELHSQSGGLMYSALKFILNVLVCPDAVFVKRFIIDPEITLIDGPSIWKIYKHIICLKHEKTSYYLTNLVLMYIVQKCFTKYTWLGVEIWVSLTKKSSSHHLFITACFVRYVLSN